jgi:hypothetical protein
VGPADHRAGRHRRRGHRRSGDPDIARAIAHVLEWNVQVPDGRCTPGLTSPPHTPCEPMPAQTAMACAAWSRALATSQVMGTGTGHPASRYTRPAGSRSVRSCGSRRTRRAARPRGHQPGCTSCPSASFIAPSSPRPRRPRILSPVSRGSRPGRTGRWPRQGQGRVLLVEGEPGMGNRCCWPRPARKRPAAGSRGGSGGRRAEPAPSVDGLEVLARRPAPGSGWTRSSGPIWPPRRRSGPCHGCWRPVRCPECRPWARHRRPGPPSCCDGAARIISTYTVAIHLREVFRQARHQVARRPGRIALEHALSEAPQTPRLGDVRGPAWR